MSKYMIGAGSMVRHSRGVGYIILDNDGCPRAICRGYDDPKRERILLRGRPTTLFKTRRAAQRALRRHTDTLAENDAGWRIVRVAPVDEKGWR